MSAWSVKGGVLKEVPAATEESSDIAVQAVKRGPGRPPKAQPEPTQEEAPAVGDQG